MALKLHASVLWSFFGKYINSFHQTFKEVLGPQKKLITTKVEGLE